MFRISILCRLAVKEGFVGAGDVSGLLDEYKTAIASEPNLPFMQWAVKAGKLSKDQARTLKDRYPAVSLKCGACGHPFTAGETDIRHPLVCTACGSDQLEILGLGHAANPGQTMPSPSSGTLLEIKTGEHTHAAPAAQPTHAATVPPSPNPMVPPPPPTAAQPGATLGNASSKAAEDFARFADSGAAEEIGVIPPGTVIGKCRVIQKIGQGGMGAVYKAHHIALDKPVALKVLAPHLMENNAQIMRFIREARSAAQLEHANIVQVMDVGEENRRFYLVMQWVEGESLQKMLDREGVLDQATAVKYIVQAAKGLGEAHGKGIIHRDIKPDNLMLTEQGTLKVADFGLAKAMERQDEINVSQTGTILGTPYYMSPEQGQNSQVDHRADIYSLGITLYQLVTGKVPFTGQSAVQIIFKHIKEPMPPPRTLVPDIDLDLNAIILQMTAKEPDERYQHMEEVAADLERILPRLSGEAPVISSESLVGVVGRTMAASAAASGARPAVGGGTWAASQAGTVIGPGTPIPGLTGSAQQVVVVHKNSGVLGALIAVIVMMLLGAGGAYYYFGILLPQQQASNHAPVALGGDGNQPIGINAGDVNITTNGNRNGPGMQTGPTNAYTNESTTTGGGVVTHQNQNQPTNTGTTNTGNTGTNPVTNTNTNPGTNSNANTNPPTNTAPDTRREILARSRLKALKDEWVSLTGKVEEYRAMAEKFSTLATEFAEIGDVRDEAQDFAKRIRDLREQEARRQLEILAPDVRTLAQSGRFIDAAKLFENYPAHFSGTDAAGEVANRLGVLRRQAEIERRAIPIREGLVEALKKPDSAEVLALAKRQFEELNTREFSSTWCANPADMAKYDAQIRAMETRLQSGELQRLFEALTIDVNRLLSTGKFRAAMARILRDKPRFVGSPMAGDVARMESDTRQQANREWIGFQERANRLAQAGQYETLFEQLRGVNDWGLDDHLKAADQFKRDFIDSYVTRELQTAEDARDGNAGMAVAEMFLKHEEFVAKSALIERYKKRFALLIAGMVPVKLPNNRVASPDGSATFTMGEYWIDRCEVTNGQFESFVRANGYAKSEFWSEEGWKRKTAQDWRFPRSWTLNRPDPGTENLPVTHITVWEAEAYAKWAGKQLPTLEQWQVAAGFDPKGGNGRGAWRVYPWGNEFKLPTGEIPPNIARPGLTQPALADVGTNPFDISPFGAMDMGGNVREWTQTLTPNPPPMHLRAGAYFQTAMEDAIEHAKAAHSRPVFSQYDAFTGFRCVKILGE